MSDQEKTDNDHKSEPTPKQINSKSEKDCECSCKKKVFEERLNQISKRIDFYASLGSQYTSQLLTINAIVISILILIISGNWAYTINTTDTLNEAVTDARLEIKDAIQQQSFDAAYWLDTQQDSIDSLREDVAQMTSSLGITLVRLQEAEANFSLERAQLQQMIVQIDSTANSIQEQASSITTIRQDLEGMPNYVLETHDAIFEQNFGVAPTIVRIERQVGLIGDEIQSVKDLLPAE